MSYTALIAHQINPDQSDLLVALLSGIGFEGFEEEDGILKAFIQSQQFEEEKIKIIFSELHVGYSIQTIENQNWNQVWEQSFEPVFIQHPDTGELFCSIQADFHELTPTTGHCIFINPKMSFGTGHHATTYLMMEEMSRMVFTEKNIFDYGTGTGILSILAEKMNAKNIDALDCDEWSIENARENFQKNECNRINLKKGDSCQGVDQLYDIILANVIYSVIHQELKAMFKLLKRGGVILLSGLLQEDADKLKQEILDENGEILAVRQRDKWVLMVAVKKS